MGGSRGGGDFVRVDSSMDRTYKRALYKKVLRRVFRVGKTRSDMEFSEYSRKSTFLFSSFRIHLNDLIFELSSLT